MIGGPIPENVQRAKDKILENVAKAASTAPVPGGRAGPPHGPLSGYGAPQYQPEFSRSTAASPYDPYRP
jgi:hypothetical protein